MAVMVLTQYFQASLQQVVVKQVIPKLQMDQVVVQVVVVTLIHQQVVRVLLTRVLQVAQELMELTEAVAVVVEQVR